jgi:uncharacterized protein YegL
MMNDPIASNKPLHFFFLVDVSGSMHGEKIQALNAIMHNILPIIKEEADKNSNAQVWIQVLKFGEGARWHDSQAVQLDEYKWTNLEAKDDRTDMGKAFELLSQAVSMPPMQERACRPLMVLLSDGKPSSQTEFDGGLNRLLKQPWGEKAVRISIAIGEDADNDSLKKFIGNVEKPRVLNVNNYDELRTYILWVSTRVLTETSKKQTEINDSSTSVSAIPYPDDNASSDQQVF